MFLIGDLQSYDTSNKTAGFKQALIGQQFAVRLTTDGMLGVGKRQGYRNVPSSQSLID